MLSEVSHTRAIRRSATFVTNEPELAANMMAAAAHLLTGRPGRHDELNDAVMVVFGPTANIPTLLHWGAWVRQTGKPIINVSFDRETRVPTFALVCVIDGQTRTFENCLPWMANWTSGAVLIPDDFRWGAYAIGADLKLKHLKKSPVRAWKAAEPGIVLAYDRLLEIAVQQVESGMDLRTPEKMEKRAG